jgi:hypothetical protein
MIWKLTSGSWGDDGEDELVTDDVLSDKGAEITPHPGPLLSAGERWHSVGLKGSTTEDREKAALGVR